MPLLLFCLSVQLLGVGVDELVKRGLLDSCKQVGGGAKN
jgi:hypothetical protein